MEVMKMSWFRRHLNWALILVWVGCVLSLNLGILVMDVSILPWLCGLCVVVVYFTAGWVLRQKGRSLWWLALLGLGLVVALFLEGARETNGGDASQK